MGGGLFLTTLASPVVGGRPAARAVAGRDKAGGRFPEFVAVAVAGHVREASPRLWPDATWVPVSSVSDDGEGTFETVLPSSAAERYFRLRLPLTRIESTSPRPGETGLSVGRETILHFSRPLAPGVTIEGRRLRARAGGRGLPGRVEVSSDRRRVSLFHLEPLPGNARVLVSVGDSSDAGTGTCEIHWASE